MILPVNKILPGVGLMTGSVKAESGALSPHVVSSSFHPCVYLHELVSAQQTVIAGTVLEDVLKQKVGIRLVYGKVNCFFFADDNASVFK